MFEELAEDWRPDGEGFVWTVPPGWGQGRAVFGGLLAAGAYALVRSKNERSIRTIQGQFLAPAVAGPIRAQLATLREGKTASVFQLDLVQGDQLKTRFLFTSVSPRPGSIKVEPPAAEAWNAPETYPELPYIEGLTPEFTQHLEYRFAEGGIPFQGAQAAAFGGYVRFRGDDDVLSSHERTVALLDAWPCPTLSVLTKPAAASTMTWSIHLLAPPAGGFHAFTYKTVAAQSGFSTAVGMLRQQDGTLAAYSEQTVVVFD
ncbi:MAG: thioesterase family protein [Myxococcota bacterium]